MTRLVAAILILFAVLIGLKASNPSLLQSNLLIQGNNPTPPTRNTGFSSEATGAATTNNAGVSSNFNAPNQVNTSNPVGANTTPLPPRPLRAVPGGW
ncbi:hypothetical protein [Stenomitos frigidus]|uniref:Uncharacterized protein n=1 Tax=Stenomitos frigidus ULC18 TaxID=2107698 RepID=A0A2T1EP08_9CYAN|nr:hypothetical protein [Stenomitos frigidus]PSB34443.1 hypothetical protein C7B82_03005 [Stenomitos frigidus ULC18]